MPSRRQLLTLFSTAVAALSAPRLARAHRRRVSQGELLSAVALHAAWLIDGGTGRRAAFTGCDLSGLAFGSGDEALVNLRGADFTDADLTGITGNNVSFLRASMQHARLSWSHLKKPTFSYANARNAICDHAVWGWDDRAMRSWNRPEPAEVAALHHTDAGYSDFTHASVRGMFVEASFAGAALPHADFSGSMFYGARFAETSFARANLTGAKFHHADIVAARFNGAQCGGIDFTGARIDPRVRHHLGAVIGHDVLTNNRQEWEDAQVLG